MQERCNSCFGVFIGNNVICPHCGYSKTEKVKSAHVLQPGTLLKNGRFIVGGKLGQGSVGIVYKAWDKRLHRVIAIKEFFPDSLAARAEGMMSVMVYSTQDVSEYEERLSMFKREARIMSLVTDSENCIKAYDVFEENGTAYITMEYFDAPKLCEYLQNGNRKTLPEEEANEIMMQLLKGVAELHEKGIYHLDLSPDNIFIKKGDDRIEIKIFSFDSAVMKGDVRRKIEIGKKRTSGFTAPELYGKGGSIGTWTDVYMLGAIYYYLLTGWAPTDASKREKDDPCLEPKQYANVSDWVNAIAVQALDVISNRRYTDAGKFREVLLYRMEREEKERTSKGKKKKSFIIRWTIIMISLLVMAVVIAFSLFDGNTDVTVWVVADTDIELEKARYEAVIKAFEETNSDITVRLEVMSQDVLENKLLDVEEEELPDLVETTYVSEMVLNRCESLASMWMNRSGNWVVGGLKGITTVDERRIPLGFYTSIRYKQPEIIEEQLQTGSVDEFIKGNVGYADSDTTMYSMVQRILPGRYKVVEAERKEIYFAEMFSIVAHARRNVKATKELLEFMMSDKAQEIMHITYISDYFPITKPMFELYVKEVFTELYFLNDAIQMYEIVQ